MNGGIILTKLFNSSVFNYIFEYEEWPGVSPCTEFEIKPFNGSIFKLRYEYKNVFKEMYDREKLIEKREEELAH